MEPNDSDWAALDPVARGEAMRTAFSKLMLRISHDIPLLLVVEDMHWIDNASQTALDGTYRMYGKVTDRSFGDL